MATFKADTTLKLLTSKSALVEEVTFAANTEVHISHSWQDFYLIKDQAGHFYNVRKELIQP